MADNWQEVARLLVVCWDTPDGLAESVPTLECLQRALPGAAISLLLPADSPQRASASWPADAELLRSPVDWRDGETLPDDPATLLALIETIRRRNFDAAVILTAPGQSPFAAAYLCYLAGIPVRLGQSLEFGGALLSQWVKLPLTETDRGRRHKQLLVAAGLIAPDRLREPAIIDSTPGEQL